MRQVFVILALAALTAPNAPPVAQAHQKIKIGLHVQFANKDIEAEATSYMSRELRSLGDVELVTSGADLVVHVLGAGEDSIAISTVVERAYHGGWFQKFGIEIVLAHAKIFKEGQEIPDETWKSAKLSSANPIFSASGSISPRVGD